MVEQGNTTEINRSLANGLFAWLQKNDEQLPPPLNEQAKKRLSLLGLRENLVVLRAALASLEEHDQLSLRLHFSGFDDEVLEAIVGVGSEKVVGDGLRLLLAQYPEWIIKGEEGVQQTVSSVRQVGARAIGARTASPRAIRQGNDRIAEVEEIQLHSPDTVATPQSDSDDDAPPEVLTRTHFSEDIVRAQLNEMGRVPLLSAVQEVELSKKIEAGLYAEKVLDKSIKSRLKASNEQLEKIVEEGREAMEHMLLANRRLVVSIARRSKYSNRGMDLEDLISEGTFGLVRAIQKFDYTKGFKFSTYATWWINQSIERAIVDSGKLIRVPVHIVQTANKIINRRRELIAELGGEPTIDELAQACKMAPEAVLQSLSYFKPVLSLDKPLVDSTDPSEATIGDMHAAEPDGADERAHTQAMVDTAEWLLTQLPTETARMIELRFGILTGSEETLDAIGRKYGVTGTTAAARIKSGLQRIREVADAAGLDVTELFHSS